MKGKKERIEATGLVGALGRLPCFILTRRQIGLHDLANFGEEVALEIV